MAKATVPRYLRPGSVRNERFLNYPRDKTRPNDTDEPKRSRILTESGHVISTESGLQLRKEQN